MNYKIKNLDFVHGFEPKNIHLPVGDVNHYTTKLWENVINYYI